MLALAKCDCVAVVPLWESAAWWPLVIQHIASYTIVPRAVLLRHIVSGDNTTPQPLRNPGWTLLLVHLKWDSPTLLSP